MVIKYTIYHTTDLKWQNHLKVRTSQNRQA